jgi:HK97 family phage major capsid protein
MAKSRLETLNEQRQRAVAAMREIADRQIAGEARGEDEAAYVKANADIDRLGQLMADERKAIAGDAEFAEAVAAAEETRGAGRQSGVERRDGAEARKELRSQVIAAIAANGGQFRAGLGGAFSLPMPSTKELRSFESRAAMVTNTATRGPEVLDETLSRNLFRVLFDDATILGAGVTVLRTETANPLKFPKLISRGALSQANARRTETAQIQKGEPTLGQIELGGYKYAQISQASSEVVRDAVIDIEDLLGSNLGSLLAEYVAYDLLLGSGSSQPRGVATIVNAGSNKVTVDRSAGANGAHVPLFDDLLDVMWKLKPAYRRNGKWLLNDATVLPLRKVKDADDNYLWAPGDATTPDTLHNRPVLVEPNMAQVGDANLSLIYGDFSKFYVRFVGQTRIDWSTEYAWDTDMVSVRGIVHADADAIDDTAFAGFVSDAP